MGKSYDKDLFTMKKFDFLAYEISVIYNLLGAKRRLKC